MEAIKILIHHQEWRKGNIEDMKYTPQQLTGAIDELIDNYHNQQKQDHRGKLIFDLLAEKKSEKLTAEILTKLEFVKTGKIWRNWILDLTEDEKGIFTFDYGRIYSDIETVEELNKLWFIIRANEQVELPINTL